MISATKILNDLYSKLNPEEILLLIYDAYPKYTEKSNVYYQLNNKRKTIAKQLYQKDILIWINADHYRRTIMKSIAADTSFYSCFYCHIEDLNCLIHLMRCYSFYIGINIFNEIPNDLKDNPIFITKIKEEEYDYVALMQPLLERDPKHLYDGEYEAIGLAYYLDTLNKLNYLIIDDRKPYNFVKRHFKHLKNI